MENRPATAIDEAALTEEQVRALIGMNLYVVRWATGNHDKSMAYNVIQKVYRLNERNEQIEIKGWYKCSWCPALLNLLAGQGTTPLLRHIRACKNRPANYVLPDHNAKIRVVQQVNAPNVALPSNDAILQQLQRQPMPGNADARAVIPPIVPPVNAGIPQIQTQQQPMIAGNATALAPISPLASQATASEENLPSQSLPAIPQIQQQQTHPANAALVQQLPILQQLQQFQQLQQQPMIAGDATAPAQIAPIPAPIQPIFTANQLDFLIDYSNRLLNIGLFHGSVPKADLKKILENEQIW